MKYEIERKYLVDVKKLPSFLNLDSFLHTEIRQGYISINPVIRVRQDGNVYVLTVKGQGLITREEFELPLTKEQFDRLWQKCDTDSTPINKTRWRIPIDNSGLVAELDIYHEQLDGLATVEVEFECIKSCRQFAPLEWFGKEVTEDSRFSNASLSLYGLPDDYIL